ncbi:hypothetical protein J3Q64DRAFT_1860126 [Phycomyces blakesleeanus]|uniref:F-box domain-containing protein n=2 Tax=Phycomyces blakesleeanus TaxID=4837 RepID=A0A163AFG3_PHYB8|nr:hypothetical protein PHYBLDRAFT_145538 [Phycomyces blakesleeanus NRRL 1555(-)]OAD73131.1 hypothetical protein PHYBLDRAFT_145538 [Phycomyces blakesleeanus NRRL 1555(-)]|eukprot:XP_018291171.1 hypothetical protein PHYBLDRAFT_145538 [Phycomyces blakesleeanus NRRL 1555(-)]
MWKSLEILGIEYGVHEEGQRPKNLVEFINACSMLQRLYLDNNKDGFRPEFGVGNFEKMYQNLQSLLSIKATLYLTPDFSATLDEIPNTKPAFALNATNIDSDPINSDQRQTVISLFRFNPNAFRHLKSFSLATDKHFEIFDFVLWKLLCPLGVSLKRLKLNANQDNGIYISGDNVDLLIDDILDSCPALKRLGFRGRAFLIKPNPTTEDLKLQQYGLQTLSLYRCTEFAKVLNYISLRCKRLRDMTLNNLWVLGFRCKNPGDLLIDMSYTLLNTLEIGIVEYSTSSKQTGRDDAVSLILLSQPNDPRLSDENKERKKTEIDPKSPLLASHHIYWLYTYEYEQITCRTGKKTIVLSEEKVDIILKYYQNVRLNTTSPNFKDDSSYDGYE